MHLPTHFLPNAKEKEKYYIKLELMKPPLIPIHEWVKSVCALNKYLDWFRSHYYCTECIKNTKEVVPHDKADLAEIVLSHITLQWQITYNLNEKGKMCKDIRELTDTLERIKQAPPKSVKL